MPKPILVGYDHATLDRAPVHFGVMAARSTGAPLVIASAYVDSFAGAEAGHGSLEEGFGGDAQLALEDLRRTLQADGVRAEYWPLGGRSAPAALHHAAETFDIGLLVLGSAHARHGGVLRRGSTVDRLMHGAPCRSRSCRPGGTPATGSRR